MRESPRWLIKQGRYQDAVASINWATGENIDYRNVVVSAADRAAEKRASFTEIFQCRRSVGVTWTTGFMQALMDYGFTLWGPTLFALVLKILGAGSGQDVHLRSDFQHHRQVHLAFPGGKIRPPALRNGWWAWASFIICMIIALFWNAWWGNVPVIYLAFIAVFVFIGGGWAVTGPYATEVWPQRLSATGMGSAYGIAGLGRIFGPFVLSLFAGAGNLVSPKATTAAIGPTYIFYAVCGLVSRRLSTSALKRGVNPWPRSKQWSPPRQGRVHGRRPVIARILRSGIRDQDRPSALIPRSAALPAAHLLPPYSVPAFVPAKCPAALVPTTEVTTPTGKKVGRAAVGAILSSGITKECEHSHSRANVPVIM